MQYAYFEYFKIKEYLMRHAKIWKKLSVLKDITAYKCIFEGLMHKCTFNAYLDIISQYSKFLTTKKA